MNAKNDATLTIRLPHDLIVKLKQRADAKGCTTSRVIRNLLRAALKPPAPEIWDR